MDCGNPPCRDLPRSCVISSKAAWSQTSIHACLCDSFTTGWLPGLPFIKEAGKPHTSPYWPLSYPRIPSRLLLSPLLSSF